MKPYFLGLLDDDFAAFFRLSRNSFFVGTGISCPFGVFCVFFSITIIVYHMSTGVADLTGIRAKISRAKEHHNTLITEWNDWCKLNANLRFCYIWRDGPWHAVMVQPLPKPSIRFSIIAGDLTHNLRCALDHLVWQLVLREGHEPTRRNEFPIFENEDLFLNEVKSRKRNPERSVLYGIKVDGDAWTIIEKAQPYLCVPAVSSPAAAIGHLSNMDKHRTLYFQISFMGYEAIRKAVAWSSDAILLEYRIGTRVLSFEKETEVVRYRFADRPDPCVHVKGGFPIDPTFGEGEVEGGRQVGLLALGYLINWVTGIADEVSKLPRVIVT